MLENGDNAQDTESVDQLCRKLSDVMTLLSDIASTHNALIKALIKRHDNAVVNEILEDALNLVGTNDQYARSRAQIVEIISNLNEATLSIKSLN